MSSICVYGRNFCNSNHSVTSVFQQSPGPIHVANPFLKYIFSEKFLASEVQNFLGDSSMVITAKSQYCVAIT